MLPLPAPQRLDGIEECPPQPLGLARRDIIQHSSQLVRRMTATLDRRTLCSGGADERRKSFRVSEDRDVRMSGAAWTEAAGGAGRERFLETVGKCETFVLVKVEHPSERNTIDEWVRESLRHDGLAVHVVDEDGMHAGFVYGFESEAEAIHFKLRWGLMHAED